MYSGGNFDAFSELSFMQNLAPKSLIGLRIFDGMLYSSRVLHVTLLLSESNAFSESISVK
jgi:hypothetical protein